MKLTPKQKIFCDEYLVDLNATQAAIRAGYSERTAKEVGYENLTKPHIQKYIDERMKNRQQRTEITQDKVLQELARVAFARGTDFAKVALRIGYRDIVDKEGKVIGQQPFEYQAVEIINTDDIPEDKRAAIASIKQGTNGIEVKPYDKVKALELLGRHLGMFNDKVELAGEMGVKIIDDIGSGDDEGS
ncbi:phage terminase small subunit [Anaerosolibacter carboniphilus]|uniref:Phage terminase small subunit n=1 Tax=Anaerosolibacter carboniphilus TaxID=1417629 RepID=A0A841L6F5_9FIRM|nr:phage terminase small subunit [Anaerosolibacter carboniphilus]